MTKPNKEAQLRKLQVNVWPCRQKRNDGASVISVSSPVPSVSTGRTNIEMGHGQFEIENLDDLLDVPDLVERFVDIDDLESKCSSVDSEEPPLLDDRVPVDNNTDEPDNVLLNWESLMELFCTLCRCPNPACGKATNQRCFKRVTRGVATSVNFCCTECHAETCCKAEKVEDGSFHLLRSHVHKHKEAGDLATKDFELNLKLVLAMQSLGCGGTGAALVMAFLGLGSGGLNRRWTDLEEDVAVKQIALAKASMDDNLTEEIALSETRNGQPLLSVQMDAGWTRRSSGHNYNSISGQHVTIGNRTSKTLCLNYYSKVCSKCTVGTCKGDDKCANPTAYDGSSKGMEGMGCRDAALHLLHKGCYIGEFVSDDDSSQRAILCRKYADLIEAGLIPCWPVTSQGYPKQCHGILPLSNGPIRHLADKNHRNRTMGSKIYKLVRAAKKNSECEKMDAERLKRGTAFCIRQNTESTLPEFRTAMDATVDHHFGDHSKCSSTWCVRKEEMEAIDRGEMIVPRKPGLYRDKVKDEKLYLQVYEVLEPFKTDESLAQLQHYYNTQKSESMMNSFTQYCPKRTHRCTTVCGKGRIHMVVLIDSVGYEEAYNRLCNNLGITFDDTLRKELRRKDNYRETARKYKKSAVFTLKRCLANRAAIVEENKKIFSDEKLGHAYGAGVALEVAEKRKRAPTKCVACKQFGHATTKNKKCKYNHLVDNKVEAEVQLGFSEQLDQMPLHCQAIGDVVNGVDVVVEDGSFVNV